MGQGVSIEYGLKVRHGPRRLFSCVVRISNCPSKRLDRQELYDLIVLICNLIEIVQKALDVREAQLVHARCYLGWPRNETTA